MLHIYYGDGKGKTTASVGLALRAIGRYKRTVIAQFLKDKPTGEILALENYVGEPFITVFRGTGTKKFYHQMTQTERANTIIQHNKFLSLVLEMIEDNECDVIILDEVLDAYRFDLIDKDLFTEILNYSKDKEIVLTGHSGVPQALLDEADYVTYMECKSHPYKLGIHAREGVEY